MKHEEAKDATKRLLFDIRCCHRCHGRMIVSQKMYATYETDSPDEIADSYTDVDCPDCVQRITDALLSTDRKARKECAGIAHGTMKEAAECGSFTGKVTAQVIMVAIRATITPEGKEADRG